MKAAAAAARLERDEEANRKRQRINDELSISEESKRRRIDGSPIDPGLLGQRPSGPSVFATGAAQTAANPLATFDAKTLPLHLVVELIIANFQVITDDALRAAIGVSIALLCRMAGAECTSLGTEYPNEHWICGSSSGNSKRGWCSYLRRSGARSAKDGAGRRRGPLPSRHNSGHRGEVRHLHITSAFSNRFKLGFAGQTRDRRRFSFGAIAHRHRSSTSRATATRTCVQQSESTFHPSSFGPVVSKGRTRAIDLRFPNGVNTRSECIVVGATGCTWSG